MKVFRLVAIALTFIIFGLQVFAGSPEQDLVVRQIRDKFKKGKLPAWDQLHLKTWNCILYEVSSDSNSRKVSDNLYRFYSQDKSNSGIVGNLSEKSLISTLWYDSNELIGFNSSFSKALIIRIIKEDNKVKLVNEFLVPRSYNNKTLPITKIPALNSGDVDYRVGSYEVCEESNL